MQPQETYQAVCDQYRQIALLKSSLALLEWDQHTKLPSSANAYRSEQITYLSGIIHRQSTATELGDQLQQLVESELASDPNAETTLTIQELKKQFDRTTKLPVDLVEALAKACSVGQTRWVEARSNDDYGHFEPQLDEILSLKKQQADAIGYSDCRYDALLDEYEPGAKSADVARVLKELCDELVPLVNAIGESSHHPDTGILKRTFPVEEQKRFGRIVSAAIGFDYQRGRLDITHHPFCTEMGPHDCRITTRYDEQFFNTSFFGTLHEAGHGIYEQGLREDQYGLPLGSYCSLGIHESQSRLWENLVGRSASFWRHFYPQAQKHFPSALDGVKEVEFYRAVNAVAPSLIRVEADEATYNLHIIIRFELELALMNDELSTGDLPDAWNQKYESYLGIRPPSAKDGVLQDVHWSAGLIGYFPTYSLGNLYASQLFEAANAQLGSLESMFAEGEFEPLKTWLNQNVHHVGKGLAGPELGQQVTGQSLSHDALARHLKNKYEAIFQLS